MVSLTKSAYSNMARTPGWIATTYNTVNSPSTFFSKGSEERSRQPVLYFAFNEGYGTTTADSSGGGNTGTLAGATTPSWQAESMCVTGKCLYYNGSTASVTVANTVRNVQSVSFWVKPKTNGETLLDLDGGSHKLTASAGTITATGFTALYVNGQVSSTLTANAWQHIVATTATPFNASSIKIGNVTSAYLNGFIDEFKLYDYARSADQVKVDYQGAAVVLGAKDESGLSDGLVGYWKMDETSWGTPNCSDSVVLDSSGSGNNGKACPNTTGPTGGAAGKFGNGGSFDGNDYVEVTNSDNLDISGSLTINMWLYSTATGTQYILDKRRRYIRYSRTGWVHVRCVFSRSYRTKFYRIGRYYSESTKFGDGYRNSWTVKMGYGVAHLQRSN